MKTAIPHQLGREEARRRLRDGTARIDGRLPAQIADIAVTWPSEDRMDLAISAMGQSIPGHVDIEDDKLVVEVTLPPLLAMFEAPIEQAVRDNGMKLLGSK